MLDMGFSDDVLAIARALPAERQTICFSATLSRGVRALADQVLREPEWMEIGHAAASDDMIDQHVIYVDGFDHRNALLEACLADEGLGQALIFTSTKRHAEELAGQLHQSGHDAVALHGDLSQKERTRALNKLRRGECKVLVATDVAARGIDVASITHVINFNLPKFAEDYVHRIGRTGRAGVNGQAVSFVGREDVFTLRKIEHFIGRKVQVSEIDGMAARFKPTERKPSPGNNGGAFRKPGFGKPGYGKPGYGKSTYARPGTDRPGTDKPGFGKPRVDKPAFGKPAYAKPEYSKPAYAKPAHAKPAYAKPGFGKPAQGKTGEKSRNFSGGGYNGNRTREAA
jgi:superfamily II DNA/RNA helicase